MFAQQKSPEKDKKNAQQFSAQQKSPENKKAKKNAQHLSALLSRCLNAIKGIVLSKSLAQQKSLVK